MRWILALLTFASANFALATTPEYIELAEPTPRLELALGFGSAQQTGYLTTQSSVGTYTMAANLLSPGGMMSFEWSGFSADHDTGEFALNNNKKVNVSTFSLLPYIKVFEHSSWRAYLGFGLAQVNVRQTDPDYSTTFGTFMLSGQVSYQFAPRWSAQLKSQWYQVEQQVNGQNTSFEVWTNVVGVAWTIK